MKRRIAVAAAIAAVLLCGKAASAHRIDEVLQATILSLAPNRVHASMRLVPGVLTAPSVIAAVDADGDRFFSAREERAYAQRVIDDLSITVDGLGVRPKLISYSFPPPAQLLDGLGEIHVEYDVDLPHGGQNRSLILANHHLSRQSVYLVNVLVPEGDGLRILGQQRDERQSFYRLDYRQIAAVDAATLTPWGKVRIWMNGVQLASLFHLGLRHIAEGEDHLLFLLVLLLPAPLVAADGRWGPPAGARRSLWRILGIVTAFTVGHSITLSLAALGAAHVPARPVEVLIAVSILVSALHALRPIFPGRESWIAAFFGLVHGLAFAAALERLGLERWQRVAGILAFNLGIETMQLLVVAAVLPLSLLLSRTRAYALLRIGGAAFAGIASLGWIAERL